MGHHIACVAASPRTRIYKIAKVVRALDWPRGVFAWEYVNMVVTSRCSAFRALTRKHECENVFAFKLARQGYFIYPFLGRLKLGKSLQTSCVILFSLKLTCWARKIRILESISLQNKNWFITRARLRVQDFGTGKNFCFNQCHNKEFLSFFLGKVALLEGLYRTCGVHSKLTNSQIVLDKSLFLFSSWFSNASLIFVLSLTHTNLLSHLKRLRLQNSWS